MPSFHKPRDVWRFWSARVQLIWGALCTSFVAMPAEQQAALLGLVGAWGEGARVAAQFVASVSVAIAAATLAARAAKQPGLEA